MLFRSVDLLPADANESEAGQVAKIMQVSDVEKLIKNALGLDLEGADSLTVVEARFHHPIEPLIDEEGTGGLDFVAIARNSSLGIMAICSLLVLRIFGGAKKKASSTATPESGIAGAEGTAGLVPAESSEPLMMRRQIANTLRSNPEQAKQLFSSWLQEKGD